MTPKQIYNREYYKKNRERLLTAQKAYDDTNREKRLERDRNYYKNNREARLKANSAYCKAHKERRNAKARERLSKKRDEINAYNRDWRRNLRLEVIAAYGGECTCCGEKEEAFLEAHHMDGGGNAHRRQLGGGAKMYGWLKRNGWPKNFGLLCSNCNGAEYSRGICPHRLKKLEAERSAA